MLSLHEKRYSGAIVRFSVNSSGCRGLIILSILFISFPADVHVRLDWLQSLNNFSSILSYHILVASLTLIRVRLATSI